jgi:uncharacterized membrane protein YgaE (UPF0421/DUF939 family)
LIKNESIKQKKRSLLKASKDQKAKFKLEKLTRKIEKKNKALNYLETIKKNTKSSQRKWELQKARIEHLASEESKFDQGSSSIQVQIPSKELGIKR